MNWFLLAFFGDLTNAVIVPHDWLRVLVVYAGVILFYFFHIIKTIGLGKGGAGRGAGTLLRTRTKWPRAGEKRREGLGQSKKINRAKQTWLGVFKCGSQVHRDTL